MINMDLENSYDPETDVHSFNPTHSDEVIENLGRESTLIIQSTNGITRIPIYDVEKTSNNITKMINPETQTAIYGYHSLQPIDGEMIDDEIIEEDMDPELEEMILGVVRETTTSNEQSRYLGLARRENVIVSDPLQASTTALVINCAALIGFAQGEKAVFFTPPNTSCAEEPGRTSSKTCASCAMARGLRERTHEHLQRREADHQEVGRRVGFGGVRDDLCHRRRPDSEELRTGRWLAKDPDYNGLWFDRRRDAQ